MTKNKKAKVSPKNKDKCIPPVCFCENGELLENGGFEIPSPDPFELFAGWVVHARTLDIELVRDTQNVFEGSAAASVRTSRRRQYNFHPGSAPVCGCDPRLPL